MALKHDGIGQNRLGSGVGQIRKGHHHPVARKRRKPCRRLPIQKSLKKTSVWTLWRDVS